MVRRTNYTCTYTCTKHSQTQKLTLGTRTKQHTCIPAATTGNPTATTGNPTATTAVQLQLRQSSCNYGSPAATTAVQLQLRQSSCNYGSPAATTAIRTKSTSCLRFFFYFASLTNNISNVVTKNEIAHMWHASVQKTLQATGPFVKSLILLLAANQHRLNQVLALRTKHMLY
jgi:hypothetical protein